MPESPVPPMNDATALAVERTRIAHDRTLMAWVRTSVSLISFGFTIYKFFQYLREGDPAARQPLGPWRFGLAMILLGLVTLVLATFQYRGDLRKLEARYGPQPGSLVQWVALLVGAVGLFGLSLTWMRR